MPSALPPLPFARHRDLIPLDRCALLVIDFQRVFTDPQSRARLPEADGALDQARALVSAFRAASRPVVFTRHAHRVSPCGPGIGSWWTHFILDGEPMSALDPRLEPAPGELLIRKEKYSAFFATRLSGWLARRKITTVVLCGVMTHVCVDTTARDALCRGYDVIVAADACASKSRLLHEASLTCLSHAAARITTVRALTAALRRRR
jgi:nicotinamidase-related amidase